MPSLSLFLTVVLTITAPDETHPEEGTICVVAYAVSSITGFEGFLLALVNVHVGLSQP
jgi:hypothetical protein